MVWPLRRLRRKRIARICLEGPIAGGARKRVLKAIRQVEEQKFPVLLLRIGVDPAVASSAFATAITDIFGFFVFLGLATLILL